MNQYYINCPRPETDPPIARVTTPKSEILTGWICPRCGARNSPSNKTCPCVIIYSDNLNCVGNESGQINFRIRSLEI